MERTGAIRKRPEKRPEALLAAVGGAFWSSLECPREPISAGGPFKEHLAIFEVSAPPRGGDSENLYFLLIY